MASNSDTKTGGDSVAAAASSKELSTKKRPALADITNLKNPSRSGIRTSIASSKPIVPCVSKIAKTKNEISIFRPSTELSRHVLPTSSSSRLTVDVPSSNACFPRVFECRAESTDLTCPVLDDDAVLVGSAVDVSFPLDERMSNCDSLESGGFGCIDDTEGKRSIASTDDLEEAGNTCKRDASVDAKPIGPAVDIDPQATITSDIYKHLRASEVNNRPSVDFMEKIQIDINPSMRATLIDWLVEVGEEYRVLGDTLFLTVNYIDRYLSSKVIRRQRLQLLGVACMMIAAKYEEISPPQVEEFCYITDNTYLKDEVLQMESAVLNHLKFEMATPTAVCFLRRFISAAQQPSEVLSIQLECMTNYIAELSLLEYSLLRYPPSLIAASATFLAKYLLSPYSRPWNLKLISYTTYQASDLCDCVKVLHHLCRCGGGRNLPAIRDKYSHHKYKYVAKKYCPLSIPPEFFEDVSP